MIPNVLSIAGTDPTGGAGIQADLKTIAALGGYGMSVVTALVAQNTQGVRSVHEVPPEFVAAQLDAVFDDVRVDAVKIGMLSNVDVIAAVAAALDRHRPRLVVLDPVMVAASGDRLLAADAVAALRDELLHRADLITPNLPEAADLLGEPEATGQAAMREQAEKLRSYGTYVLLKGGHLSTQDSTDVLAVDGELHSLSAPRVDTKNTHGTGCTLSSAVATLRPSTSDWLTAVGRAKDYLTDALRAADDLDVGHGHGPVHHTYAITGAQR
jgi:hydroxymethylpyrimidine/phosphomethylpyrimidine kinase